MSTARAQGLHIGVLCVSADPRVQALLYGSIAYDPALELVGTAQTLDTAISMTRSLHPDVVALDMSLCLSHPQDSIRALKVAGAALVALGAASPALAALNSGADDFLPVPLGGSESDNSAFLHDTVSRIKVAIAGLRLPSPPGKPLELIVAAGSRGGPAPLAALLAGLPGDRPAVVAAMHGAAMFGDLPSQLRAITSREIVVVADALPIRPNTVCLPAVGRHIAVERVDGDRWVVARRGAQRWGRLPSADVLFRSAVRSGCAGVAGVLLSEGGPDGLEGLQSLQRNGALAYRRYERASLNEAGEAGVRVRPLEDIIRDLSVQCEQ